MKDVSLWMRFVLLLGGAIVAIFIAFPSKAGEYVPREALKYQRDLIRNARVVWGLTAPIAAFAGQIHQESRWNPDAKSAFAGGLAQFTPATATWIAGVYPAELGSNQPFNPVWALRALVQYDLHLWNRVSGADSCERFAFTLSAYNGGPGWVTRDKKLAQRSGADPERWFSHVELYNAGRREDFFRENRGYPQRILKRLQYLYAAWGPMISCSG